RGNREKLRAPVKSMAPLWSTQEKLHVETQLRESIHGDQTYVRQEIEKLLERTGADEIMVNTMVFEQSEKLRSYRLLSELMDK
ncbi:LLM class flavin-dependent oxidoreductase, partial [Escherichia coli]|nr:LLM class flavin-dependent oxidoreductase [Escherichia coli]